MSLTHDPYLLQTHSQARIDTGLAKPQGVACTSSLMPLPERLSQPHQPASVEQRRHPPKAGDDAGHIIGQVAGGITLVVAFASFLSYIWPLL